MASLKPRYTTRFHFVASARLDAPATKQMEAVASLDKLRALLPRDIDPDAHPTLLFVAGNLAVGGCVNLNDDGMRLEDTIATYRAYEWQLVDVEHLRSDIKGFIVKAGLSELGTDRLITEDEARAAGKPVNVAIVVALWKVADPDLCAFVEQMDAPASPDKDKLSFSFEVGFDDYDIVVLPKDASNLTLASRVVTPDDQDFDKFDRLLRVNGGKGAFGTDSRVARIIMGNIIPLGAGIVTVPAAAVKGLTTITSNPHVEEVDAADAYTTHPYGSKCPICAAPTTWSEINRSNESACKCANGHEYKRHQAIRIRRDGTPWDTDAGLYKYSSTQVTLSEADAAPFLAYAAAIPDAHIYTDADDLTLGREKEPHITALYGIKSADHTQVQKCLEGCGPVSVTLGEVSAFVNEDKPYDVLKIDVKSDDLHKMHHLIKTATATETKWPDFSPHLTIGYLKKGHAAGYVGDTRFKGRGLTFPSIHFSPHTGDRVEIPLKMLDGTKMEKPLSPPYTDQFGQVHSQEPVIQNSESAVYNEEDSSMATPSRQIKLSQGWQERLAALQAEAGKEGNPALENGVNVTLSDGRTLSNVKVFDGQTLELDKELSMTGWVITDMTPGARPQADDNANETPSKDVVYPNVNPQQQAQNEANEAMRKEAQNAGYTDANLKGDPLTEDEIVAAADKAKKPYGDVQYADPGYQADKKKRYPVDTEEHIRAAWSYINQAKNAGKYSSEQVKSIKSKIVSAWKKHIDPKGPESAKASVGESIAMHGFLGAMMNSLAAISTNASLTSVSSSNPTISSTMNLSELKQSLAAVKTVEDLPTAVANVALFADAIAKASEQMASERKTAQEAAQAAQASVAQIKADLDKLTATHNEMVATQQAAAAEAKFNDRMNAVEAAFDLDNDIRAEIVDEVKACATDEVFAKWFASAKKKMKGWMKKKAKDDGDAEDKKDGGADEDTEDTKAKKAAKAALASAASNEVDPKLHQDYQANATLSEQMQATFAKNISVGGVKVADLNKNAKK